MTREAEPIIQTGEYEGRGILRPVPPFAPEEWQALDATGVAVTGSLTVSKRGEEYDVIVLPLRQFKGDERGASAGLDDLALELSTTTSRTREPLEIDKRALQTIVASVIKSSQEENRVGTFNAGQSRAPTERPQSAAHSPASGPYAGLSMVDLERLGILPKTTLDSM